MTEPVQIRPAATVVLWRRGGRGTAEVLMGQRGAGAVFMPSKYVFPGGGVDAEDHAALSTAGLLSARCHDRLTLHAPDSPPPAALAAAARRELAEEAGLAIAPAPHPVLRFIFRAITPPGRGRRFDARFFLAHAGVAQGDAEGFAGASGELSHLHWIALDQARGLDLPFVTEVVLAEVGAILAGHDQPGVPFFDNSGPVPTFRRLG